MARSSYRRRNDGIIEIVRPRPWQRLGGSLKNASAALLLVLVGVASVALYTAFGVPFLVLAGSLGCAGLLWRSGARDRRPSAPVTPVGSRRTAAP